MICYIHQQKTTFNTKGGQTVVERFEKFSYYLSELSRYWHKIAAEEMAEYGLKGPYAVYFTTLYQYPDGLTPVELGALCSRDKADVSRAVSLLEKKELVRKSRDGERQYRARVTLTETGWTLAENISHKANAAVEQGGKGLTEAQRESLYFALELITANLQVLSRDGLNTIMEPNTYP